MKSEKYQMFDSLKKLFLIGDEYNLRLNSMAVESGRMTNKKHSQLNRNNSFTSSHKGTLGESSGKNTSARHARNFLVNAVAISICMTALILSMDALPVIFKVIAFCGSLMAGFIIEFMLNGDEYE